MPQGASGARDPANTAGAACTAGELVTPCAACGARESNWADEHVRMHDGRYLCRRCVLLFYQHPTDLGVALERRAAMLRVQNPHKTSTLHSRAARRVRFPLGRGPRLR